MAGRIDKGLFEVKKQLEIPLTREELVEAEKFHKHISHISNDELKRPFTM